MSALDKLFGRGNVTYHIAVAEALDSVAAAIFAEQIAFWQAKSEDGWAFRSIEQIHEYTGLKKAAQQGARKVLLASGVMLEEHRGMPARNFYRIDLDALAELIENPKIPADSFPPPVDRNLPSEDRNQPTGGLNPARRSIEGVEREEQRVPERSDQKSDKVVPLNQYFVRALYDALDERYGIKLRKEQFSFHLGQFGRMLDQYEPSEEEERRVMQHMVERFPSSPKIDALTAIQDVRLGRDDGSAWTGPAPWEKARAENREPSYYEKKYPTGNSEDAERWRREEEELTRQLMEEG